MCIVMGMDLPVYLCTCRNTCVGTYVYAKKCTYIYADMYVDTNVCMCVCARVCERVVCECVHMCV